MNNGVLLYARAGRSIHRHQSDVQRPVVRRQEDEEGWMQRGGGGRHHVRQHARANRNCDDTDAEERTMAKAFMRGPVSSPRTSTIEK